MVTLEITKEVVKRKWTVNFTLSLVEKWTLRALPKLFPRSIPDQMMLTLKEEALEDQVVEIEVGQDPPLKIGKSITQNMIPITAAWTRGVGDAQIQQSETIRHLSKQEISLKRDLEAGTDPLHGSETEEDHDQGAETVVDIR